MKKSMIKRFFLLALVSMSYLLAGAQGVVVCKKDGAKIKVPYSELDSISTYNLGEDPDGGNADGPQTFIVNGVSFTMMPVEGGTFTMGMTPEQPNPSGVERTTHSVTLSSYMMGETEVTQGLWQAVMGHTPTSDGDQWSSDYGLGAQYPAYHISWNDVQEFITKLNQLTGKTFRMPTEAEWEYAARGGNKSRGYQYSGSDNVDDVAWYGDNSGYKAHPVKTKFPNELGLYDMSGNVLEWCSDLYGSYSSEAQQDPKGPSSGSSRVLRGGSWIDGAWGCCVSLRRSVIPSGRDYTVGFRLALDYSDKPSTEEETGGGSGGTQTFTVKGVGFTMMPVEGGTFTMGATPEQQNPNSNEKPTHSVTLSSYMIGETEVTQGLWLVVMGYTPTSASGRSEWSFNTGMGADYPAYYISWDDVQEFITKLNQLTGKTFRLPTEAEWEFAARGGNKSKGYQYSGSNTIGDVAWYWNNSYEYSGSPSRVTHPVKTKSPNELGIYDMSGNVEEWCSDCYGSYSSEAQQDPKGSSSLSSYRVFRGGNWNDDARECRVAFRDYTRKSDRGSYGFRLAL